tara:strand:+ start:2937 stop:3641 length:705 start_codon:yes stop_codon:yes gene_type:complete
LKRNLKNKEKQFNSPLDDLGLVQALNYYNINFNAKDSKIFLVSYLENHEDDRASVISACPENRMVNTCGYVARLLSRNIQIPLESMRYFWSEVQDIYEVGLEYKKERENLPVQPPKPVLKEVPQYDMDFGEVLAEVDNFIESDCKNFDFRMKAWLAGKGLIKRQAKQYAKKLQEELKYVDLVLERKDKQLVEGYSNYNRNALKRLKKFYEKLIGECEDYAKTTPRRKKVNVSGR